MHTSEFLTTLDTFQLQIYLYFVFIQAANDLLYPMNWQNIFIPLLPKHLLDMLQAPMPFLIGVPYTLMQKVRSYELAEVVVLNADEGTVVTQFDDVSDLPFEVREALKKGLNNRKEPLIGDAVPR